MKIEILGTGCPKCKILEDNAKRAATELGLKVEFVKITDIEEIIAYGVMSTPAIVIDGKLKANGRIPDVKEIQGWLKQ